jgi:hypothetical protein
LLLSLEGITKELKMKRVRGFVGSKFSIFLCFTFFLTVSGFPAVVTQAKDAKFPIGEMISKGGVRFEAREKVWKNIDSSHFPVFEKGKIKTEQGTGMVTLGNNCHIEIAQNSVISFEQVDRVHLTQGKVSFRIPSSKEMTIKVGSLAVTKPRVQQASKGTAIIPAKNEDTVGSITLHSNGSVTIRNLQGSLSILDQDRVVVAALSSKESITIPATMASGKSYKMMAQAGEVRESKRETQNVIDQEWTYLGLNAIEWIAVGYAAALVGGLTYVYWPEGDKDRTVEQEQVPICP